MMKIKKTGLLLFLLGGFILSGCGSKKIDSKDSPWDQLTELKSQIKVPTFPDRTFNITDYGAVGDGKTKNTEAFKKTIQAAHENGGGKVVVPNGTFLTGAIHLKSNINLHLQDDATILFSQDTSDYLPMVFTRYEGIELMNYSPFIYAYKKKNIAITGNGMLDGNADKEHWWPWAGDKEDGWEEGDPSQDADRDSLHVLNEKQVSPKDRKFGAGHYLRPNFIQTYDCENVLIKGVTIHHSPMWEVHPVLSENVIIDGIHIETLGPNNDGIDPESSKNVWIKNCYFDTGDDCIAIKSGRNEDGRRIGVPSENIIVEDSKMKNGHGGIVMGSEISGGVKNVYAQNLTMDSPDLERVLRIKTSSQRGGITQGIHLRNIDVGTYKEAAIKANMFYEPAGDHMPTIRNITVENLQVENGGEYGILIKAYKESPVTNLTVTNSTIKGVDEPMKINHIKNMKLENVTINGKKYNQ